MRLGIKARNRINEVWDAFAPHGKGNTDTLDAQLAAAFKAADAAGELRDLYLRLARSERREGSTHRGWRANRFQPSLFAYQAEALLAVGKKDMVRMKNADIEAMDEHEGILRENLRGQTDAFYGKSQYSQQAKRDMRKHGFRTLGELEAWREEEKRRSGQLLIDGAASAEPIAAVPEAVDWVAEFYASEFWAEEREWVFDQLGYECERCGDCEPGLHVHHQFGLPPRDRLYERQNIDSYEVLCPDCHAEHHGRPEIADFGDEAMSLADQLAAIRWAAEEEWAEAYSRRPPGSLAEPGIVLLLAAAPTAQLKAELTGHLTALRRALDPFNAP